MVWVLFYETQRWKKQNETRAWLKKTGVIRLPTQTMLLEGKSLKNSHNLMYCLFFFTWVINRFNSQCIWLKHWVIFHDHSNAEIELATCKKRLNGRVFHRPRRRDPSHPAHQGEKSGASQLIPATVVSFLVAGPSPLFVKRSVCFFF